jgi:hypothetical protein
MGGEQSAQAAFHHLIGIINDTVHGDGSSLTCYFY